MFLYNIYNIMRFSILTDIFSSEKHMKVNIQKLPSQGYFYPKDLEILIKKGDIDDQIKYQYGLGNSNIFGIIDTVRNILKEKLKFRNSKFRFNSLRSIDIFYIFIMFVKHTTGKKIIFNNIEFSPDNFIYFDFSQFKDKYDEEYREFIFNGWKFSLPSIGTETSINHFSYELAIKGKSEQYQDSNYNLIYFLGNRTEQSYDDIINLIEIFEDLDEESQNHINRVVEKFSKSGLYFLIEHGKQPTRINPHMLKDIWPIE